MSLYVGQNVELSITCIVDKQPMSNAIGATILVAKPDRTSESWDATVDNITGKILATGNLPIRGLWKFQPMVEFAVSGIIPGTPFEFTVEKLIA
jgi:hypothetical protein